MDPAGVAWRWRYSSRACSGACATAAAGRAAHPAASPGALSGTFPAPTLRRRTASVHCCHSTSCCNISTRFSAEADVDVHLAQPPGSRADVSMTISAGELEIVLPQGPGRPRHPGTAGCACIDLGLSVLSQLICPATSLTFSKRTLRCCRVPDGRSTRELLEAHLQPALGGGLKAGHRLRAYAQAGLEQLVVLMRRPNTPARPASGNIA